MHPRTVLSPVAGYLERSSRVSQSRARGSRQELPLENAVRQHCRKRRLTFLLAVSGLLLLPALAPAEDTEWSLGLRFADDSALGFQQGLEVIGGGRWHLSRHLGMEARANVGTITKTDSDGSSWGYSLEALVGGERCWARLGVAGSGYSAETTSGDAFSKSVSVAPLIGFACDSFRKRIRWGVVAATRPAASSGFGEDEDEPWSISFPISYRFAEGRWRYGSASTLTQGLENDLWSWSIFIERRWR